MMRKKKTKNLLMKIRDHKSLLINVETAELFLTKNSPYKMKCYPIHTKQCRKPDVDDTSKSCRWCVKPGSERGV